MNIQAQIQKDDPLNLKTFRKNFRRHELPQRELDIRPKKITYRLQTTKIVQAPSEVIETPLVEPCGPGRPDKSQGLDDDLISLFAGDDFNLSDDNTMDNTTLLTNIDSALSSSTEK